MKVRLSSFFLSDLKNQVDYISLDKPLAAKKFKKDLIINLKKDLKSPFGFKQSIYFKESLFRNYVFKGYNIVYKIDDINKIVTVIALIKYQDKLQ